MTKQLEKKTLENLVSDLLEISLKNLGHRYSVNIDGVLSKKVETEFDNCLRTAICAFATYLSHFKEIMSLENVVTYLKSSVVAEEVWHLLDPGAEIFDIGHLAQYAEESLSLNTDKSVGKLIYDAWEEFLKAFSFASRSAPELREFLRASYEAGNFRTLSNIEDVLDNMNTAISSFKDEEIMVSHAIKSYTEELQEYKTWAINFS